MIDHDLFKPFQLGVIALSNRVVMAPLTRNRATRDNLPNAMMLEYYVQRASAGLLITEGAQVSPEGVGYPFTPGIHNQQQCDAWREVTSAVQKAGGKIFIQLWHVGRVSHSSLQPNNALPLAPSAIPAEGVAITYEGEKSFETPSAMTTEQIDAVVEQYKTAAAYAKQAGFDGVEIHAANGYLLDQFIRDGSNHRSDQYGGSLENRVRLLHRVIAAVSSVWNSRQVGVRISPINSFNGMSDSDPSATFSYVANTLNAFDLAYLHVMELDFAGQGSLDFKLIRQAYNGSYMANGGYDRQRAMAAIDDGNADLVSFGVFYIANPDLVARLEQDAPLNEPDRTTFYGGDEKGYTDYPSISN